MMQATIKSSVNGPARSRRWRKRKTLIVQATAGLAGLPACRQITRVARVFQETRQLGVHAPSLAFVRQPDIRLCMLLNSQDNALRRHIVDKRLATRGLLKEVIINMGSGRLFPHKGTV